MSSNEFSTRLTRDFSADTCTHLNPVSRHIIDADCEYEAGAFKMFCLPGRLPNLFTIRFTAPADFSAGDAITLKGRECAVKTRTMDEPGDGFFKAGAVVHCEIDMERDLAFFAAADACGEVADCPFQENTVEFYIDPAGTNSMATSGKISDPFKSLAGALRIVSRKFVPTLAGNVVFKINPGVYPAEPLTMNGGKWAAGDFIIQATNPADRPVIGVTGNLLFSGGMVRCDNICFDTETGVRMRQVHASLTNCRIKATKPGSDIINIFSAWVTVTGELELDGNGQQHNIIVLVQQNATLFVPGHRIKYSNVPSVGHVGMQAAWASAIIMPGTTVSGAFSGKKFSVAGASVLYVDNSSALPGSLAGIKETGGFVF